MLKGIITSNSLNDYEKENKRASYRTIVERYIGDIVLCNNIFNIDESVWDNLNTSIEDEDGNYIDFFQCYLCNINEDIKEELTSYGLYISYSDKLECDVLLVDHWGTSWDYVLTDCPIYDTFEELEQANN